MLQNFDSSVTGVSRIATVVCQESYRGITGVLQEYYRSVTGTSQSCLYCAILGVIIVVFMIDC